MERSGVYIHIPFCRNKCLYCDFYSAGLRIADWPKYINCLLKELNERQKELFLTPSTLYIGGGTPSLIPVSEFEWLIHSVNEVWGVKNWDEFTIEVNPEDINENKCDIWKKSGVNRISIGIQSLCDEELQKIGRRHSASEAIEAIRLLKKYFRNISVDLMFGLPGQTPKSYKENLKAILNLSPQHISSYALMLEPGTPMTLLQKEKRINLPDENEWEEMYRTTHNILKENGYIRYEISNFALPGFESLHNSSYWLSYPYLGIGPGAHSYDGNRTRRGNPSDLKRYLNFFSPGSENDTKNYRDLIDTEKFYEEEYLSDIELKEEYILTRLRMANGIDINEFSNKFGEIETKRILAKSEKYVNSAEMFLSDESLGFTDKGIAISDRILSDLI